MALWLNRLGARDTGVSLQPTSKPDLFNLVEIAAITDSHIADIRDAGGCYPLAGRWPLQNFQIEIHTISCLSRNSKEWHCEMSSLLCPT